jgi:2-methylisocitrate lyase-like PEP mutase family enzyme
VTAGQRFRDAVESPGIKLAPNIYNGMSAKLVENAGDMIGAILGSGSLQNTLMGAPASINTITLTDMDQVVRQILSETDIPLIVDVDDGFGNALCVAHTVRTLESAGAAGILIDDDDPTALRSKRMTRKLLITPDEFVQKIKAAVDARRDDSFIVMVRTHAGPLEGCQSAVDRLDRAIEVGGDWAFLNETTNDNMTALAAVKAPHKGATFRQTSVLGFSDVTMSLEEYLSLGIDILTTSGMLIYASAVAMVEYLQAMKVDWAEANEAIRERMKAAGFDYRSVLREDRTAQLEDRYAV